MGIHIVPERDSSGKTLSKTQPFAAKEMDGLKLFKRIHGAEFDAVVGENTFVFTIPYNQIKINGMEIIGGELGDKCNFDVHDNDAGTISTVPDLKLNQFGFDVNVAPTYYKHRSEYDADMILGMKLKLIYSSISAKKVYVNFELNELKP